MQQKLNFLYMGNIAENYTDNFANGIVIEGIAIDDRTTFNGMNYAAELKEIAEQLVGLSVVFGSEFDHSYNVQDAVGKVIEAYYDPIDNVVRFKARITNNSTHPDVEERILRGDVPFVSIGGFAENVIDKGTYKLLRGIHVTHLALTSMPGCKNAKIYRVKKIGESMEAFDADLIFNNERILRTYIRKKLFEKLR